MTVTPNGELLLHVDVCPSEQVRDADDLLVRCMVGLVSDNAKGVSGLRSYKETKGLHPITKKTNEALRIVEAMRGGEVNLQVVACLGHGKHWHRFGREILATIPESVAIKEAKGYRVGDTILPEPTAVALASYAAGLGFICHHGSKIAKIKGCRKVAVLLDRLPTSNVCKPTELVRRILHHRDMLPVWKELQETYNVKFQFADNWTFEDTVKGPVDGRKHPNSIITDWICQSTNAAVNTEHWLGLTKGRTEEQRRKIAEPFFYLYENKGVRVVDLNKLVASERLSSHGIE